MLMCINLTLSTLDNAKLLQQLKLGLKRTIYWNINVTMQMPNLNYLTDPSFQGVDLFYHLIIMQIEQDTQNIILCYNR